MRERISEDYNNYYRFSAQSLSVSGSFCVNLVEKKCCFLRNNLQHKSVPKGEGVRFFRKIILSENDFLAIDYQEHTTICLLRPKIVGRKYLWTNNWYIMFIRFIIQNNTAHHFCKNL